MSTGGIARYRQVLRQGHVARPFAATVVGRLPIAMAPLAILLLVRQEQGTYAAAGLVAGALAVGVAVGGPWWGSRIDRFGQSRVMLGTSLVCGVLIVTLSILAVLGAPFATLVTAAFLAGATFPPLGPAMRATWQAALPEPEQRQVAYALDAVAVESLFVGGPLLLSLLLAFSAPAVPLLVTAALLVGGGTAYSCARAVRQQAPRRPSTTASVGEPRRPSAGVLRAPGVAAALVTTLAVSVGFGQLDSCLAATARQVLGSPGRVGLLFMATAGGSVAGGLLFGARRPSPDTDHHLLWVALAGFTAGLATVTALLSFGRPTLWQLMPVLFLTGLSIAPSLIITQNLVQSLTARERVSEAQAWLTTAGTAGGAAGTSLAGILIDRLGLGWSFGGATAAVAVGAIVSLLHRDRWSRHRRSRRDALPA